MLRPLRASDIPAVLSIQQACYPADIQESEAVIRARFAGFAPFCWVAEDEGGACAYLFAYPSRIGKVTPLDADFVAANEPDCLYLHDLAVAPRAAGRGLGPALVARLLALASTQQLRHSALVSVQDSARFWSRLGFAAHPPLDQPQRRHLASYPIPAVYMVRPLH